LIALGNSKLAAANALSISAETVKSYMKSIIAKLSARDRTHARRDDCFAPWNTHRHLIQSDNDQQKVTMKTFASVGKIILRCNTNLDMA
jgi:Bacterial regulatory proteins, luxR family